MKNWTACLSEVASLLHEGFPCKVMLSYENNKSKHVTVAVKLLGGGGRALSHFYSALDRQDARIRKKG